MLTGIIITISAFSQAGLDIQTGTSLLIKTGTTVSIDSLILQPSTDFTIIGQNTLTRKTTLTNPLLGWNIKRAFLSSNITGPFDGTVSVYYRESELNGLDENTLMPAIYDGTIWNTYATGITRDPLNNVVSTTDVSSTPLNELTLISLHKPLPLTWGPVTSFRRNKLAYVQWTTYNEQHVDHFELESSLNGSSWKKTGTNTAATNTNTDHHYTSTDPDISDYRTYYRVKEIDIDGKINYSEIVSVGPVDGKSTLSVYPNPIRGQSQVTIQFNGPQKIQTICLYDEDGKIIEKEKVNNMSSYRLETSGLHPGLFFLQMSLNDGTIINHQLLKQ